MAPRTCPICTTQVSSLSTSPTTCTSPKTSKPIKHTDQDTDISGNQVCKRACSECWEAHISYEVERRHSNDAVQCLFCPSPLNEVDIKRLCRVDTFQRYEKKHLAETKMKCQNRCQGPATPYQEISGRLFTCENCDFSTCVDCDVPEHPERQTCAEHRDRLNADLAFQTVEELTSEKFKRCPNCSVPFTVEKGCGYVQCTPGRDMTLAGIIEGGCGFRFCAKCLIPWVGEGSDYLCGKEQHREDCRYYKKFKPSMYSLKRRFEQVDGSKEDEDNEVGKLKKKARAVDVKVEGVSVKVEET